MHLLLQIWEFPKIRGPSFGVLIIGILLFRIMFYGPLFSETPIYQVVGYNTGFIGAFSRSSRFDKGLGF